MPIVECNDRNVNLMMDRLEQQENVRVLYACISGSQAWGLNSRDSDQDIRYIYVRPFSWYLDIAEKKPDTMDRELPPPNMPGSRIDAYGWDLRKALHLFRKSNPSLMEWLDSPIVYREKGPTIERLRQMQTRYTSPKSLMWHYWNLASRDAKDYYKYEHSTGLKHYLYIIRSLLCCRWVELYLEHPTCLHPPLQFDDLQSALVKSEAQDAVLGYPEDLFDPAEIRMLNEAIDLAVAQKRSHIGYFVRKRNDIFNTFIDREIARLEDVLINTKFVQSPDDSAEELNRLFRLEIME